MKIPDHKTQLFGILGNPLSHTLSPLIHNTLFTEMAYNGLYLVFEKAELNPTVLAAFRETGIKGLSVTIPHKEKAFQCATDSDFASQRLGASNTIIMKDSRIFAYNTDGYGALKAIQMHAPETLENDICILGNGGSAKGILQALAESKFTGLVYLAARNVEKSEQIAKIMNTEDKNWIRTTTLDSLESLPDTVNLWIQTTPIGMKGQTQLSLIPESILQRKPCIFDIVYNPLETELVKNATAKGCKVIPGYEMLLFQAIRQFELFTGMNPREQVILEIRSKLYEALSQNG